MNPADVTVAGDDLLVKPLIGTLPEVKTLGASWDSKRGAWKLAACRMNAVAVRELLPDAYVPSVDLAPWTPAHDVRLYDFQKDAAGRLASAPRGQIVVASPGLGKTAIAIIAADIANPTDQIVVVAPAPLLRTWRREIKLWCVRDKSVAIIHGGEPDWDEVSASRWLITTWDVLSRHQDWFKGQWPLWIFDESVMAKSRASQRSMGVRGGTRRRKVKADGTVVPAKHWENMRKSIERVWLLSGSPTTRFADDMWAQLALVWPRAFASYWRFAERYCVIEDTVWSRVVIADRRDRSVMEDNSDLVMVINQEDVIDLPEYLFEAVDVELAPKQRKAYLEMLKDFVTQLDSGVEVDAENKIAQLIRLQQIVSYWDGASAKHDAVIDLIKAGVYEAPYLIWTHWRESAEALTVRLEREKIRVAHVSGGMSAKEKDEKIEDYKKGKIDCLVLSLGVGKFGHTLTNTKTVMYVDKTWNADDYFQSLRRVRRIGLRHRPVVATIRAPGTTDELLELNLAGKIESISRITNARLKELIMGLGQ